MKSGNHTSSPQWLYLLGNFPYFWIVKIGIGGKLKARERQIDRSAKGMDFILFALWFPWAYQVEQIIHAICAPLRARFNGSGHTERFYFPAALVYFLVGGGWFVLSWGSVAVFIYVVFLR